MKIVIVVETTDISQLDTYLKTVNTTVKANFNRPWSQIPDKVSYAGEVKSGKLKVTISKR